MKIKKITELLIIIFITASLSAQDNNCNFSKAFPVRPGSNMHLANKYGNVNIINGTNDSISICATITIVQDDSNLVKKSLKLITISIDKLNDTISISTMYDKKFFSEESRQGRKNFSVDYLIKLPSYMDINISDEFGDVTLEELSGTLKVQLSQGVFTARKLLRGDVKPLNSVYISHGKLIIGELNWMTLNLLNCPSVDIEKAQAINMVSSISKIHIGDIKSLVCNSKSDNYKINSITNLYSESIYSGFTTGTFYGQLKTRLTYGSFSISNLNKGFSSIEITSNQAQINLSTGSVLSFNTDITGNDAILIFPFNKYPGIIKTQTENTTSLIGLAGVENGTKSLIRIRATGGQVTIQ